MELTYTYWEASEGGYIGFINQYPEHWTQGDTQEELEDMLKFLYDDLMEFEDIESATPQKIGKLVLAV